MSKHEAKIEGVSPALSPADSKPEDGLLPVGFRLNPRAQPALKKLTRRQAQAWLLPMRQCFRQILDTGETDAIRGYAVTKLHASDDYARIDYCCAGFRGLMDRLCPHIDSQPLRRIEQRLAAGAPLTDGLLTDALRMLRAVEDELIKHSVAEVKDAVLAEQILIEMDEIRVAA